MLETTWISEKYLIQAEGVITLFLFHPCTHVIHTLLNRRAAGTVLLRTSVNMVDHVHALVGLKDWKNLPRARCGFWG